MAEYDYHLLNNTLIVGALLFALGAMGFIARRNAIIAVLSFGIMLQGVLLSLVSFGMFHRNDSGQIFALFALAVSVCQGAIAFVLFAQMNQREKSLDLLRLKGATDPDSDSTTEPARGATPAMTRSPEPGRRADSVVAVSSEAESHNVGEGPHE